jgi:hypothetical protein
MGLALFGKLFDGKPPRFSKLPEFLSDALSFFHSTPPEIMWVMHRPGQRPPGGDPPGFFEADLETPSVKGRNFLYI